MSWRHVALVLRWPDGKKRKDLAEGEEQRSAIPLKATESAGVNCQRAVLFVLADYAADDSNLSWPSAKTIAKESGRSERNVRHALAALRDQGVIIPMTSALGGRANTVRYRLALVHNPGAGDTLSDEETLARATPFAEETLQVPTPNPASTDTNPGAGDTRSNSEALYKKPSAQLGSDTHARGDAAALTRTEEQEEDHEEEEPPHPHPCWCPECEAAIDAKVSKASRR
jgi:hypothetical protein